MIFTTKEPTLARSMLGYWLVVCMIVAGAANVYSPEAGALAILGIQVLAPLGWFVLIAWDVRTLGDALKGQFKFIYPALAIFSGIGVLLYLWDRERNLTSQS